MLKLRKEQLHDPVLADRHKLIKDIEEHLAEYRPDIIAAYSRPYLLWLINDSIDIASKFRIDDVFSMRLFVRLRWEIAPIFYEQMQIAHVLSQTERSAEDRFKELGSDSFAQAWEDAEHLDKSSDSDAHF